MEEIGPIELKKKYSKRELVTQNKFMPSNSTLLPLDFVKDLFQVGIRVKNLDF